MATMAPMATATITRPSAVPPLDVNRLLGHQSMASRKGGRYAKCRQPIGPRLPLLGCHAALLPQRPAEPLWTVVVAAVRNGQRASALMAK